MMAALDRVHTSLEDAIYDVHHYGGVSMREISTDTGIPASRLYDAVNQRREQPYHATWIVPVTKRVRHFGMVRFIARAVGGVFLKIPDHTQGSLATMTAGIGELMREIADVIQVGGDAVRDGRLEPAEKAAVLQQLQEARRTIDALEQLVLQLPTADIRVIPITQAGRA